KKGMLCMNCSPILLCAINFWFRCAKTNQFYWKHPYNEFLSNLYNKWNIPNCDQSNIAKSYSLRPTI
ncbi:Os09g0267800, partial [Oryza sativa Japonica Group]